MVLFQRVSLRVHLKIPRSNFTKKQYSSENEVPHEHMRCCLKLAKSDRTRKVRVRFKRVHNTCIYCLDLFRTDILPQSTGQFFFANECKTKMTADEFDENIKSCCMESLHAFCCVMQLIFWSSH